MSLGDRRNFTMTRLLRMQLSKSTAEMPMKLTNRVTGGKRLTIAGLGIALLIVLGICCSVAALATPRSGLLFLNSLSTATAQSFAGGSQNGVWQIQLQTNGPTDIITQNFSYLPGGFSGWHLHPGPAIVSVTAGAATFYEGSDPSCTPHVFAAGTGFVETGSDVHIVRNEGADALTINVTFLVPQGAPPRMDQPSPGNCSF
jgi:quercetin dioxygenase-like cupin family protein